jgi:hypothetical protein
MCLRRAAEKYIAGAALDRVALDSRLTWRKGCQPYALAALYSPETLFVCFWYSLLSESE